MASPSTEPAQDPAFELDCHPYTFSPLLLFASEGYFDKVGRSPLPPPHTHTHPSSHLHRRHPPPLSAFAHVPSLYHTLDHVAECLGLRDSNVARQLKYYSLVERQMVIKGGQVMVSA